MSAILNRVDRPEGKMIDLTGRIAEVGWTGNEESKTWYLKVHAPIVIVEGMRTAEQEILKVRAYLKEGDMPSDEAEVSFTGYDVHYTRTEYDRGIQRVMIVLFRAK